MIINQFGGTNRSIPEPGGKRSRLPEPQLISAGMLTGEKVVDTRNSTLGKINEIMIDVASGRIAYAVMSCNGIPSAGEKLFAIPWQALELDAENECFVLDIDKERLERAPGFNQDHWPSMADPKWGARIHNYFGSRPYWE